MVWVAWGLGGFFVLFLLGGALIHRFYRRSKLVFDSPDPKPPRQRVSHAEYEVAVLEVIAGRRYAPLLISHLPSSHNRVSLSFVNGMVLIGLNLSGLRFEIIDTLRVQMAESGYECVDLGQIWGERILSEHQFLYRTPYLPLGDQALFSHLERILDRLEGPSLGWWYIEHGGPIRM